MNRLTQDHSTLRNWSQCLLMICLWLGLCAFAQAAGYYPNGLDAQTLNSLAQHSTGDTPVITCGKQPGQRPASLEIRGADVTTLWRSAYRMLFPSLSLTTNSKMERVSKLPRKGPAWGISISHDRALVTVQTKW